MEEKNGLSELTTSIKNGAHTLGFELVGIASIADPILSDALAHYDAWLASKHMATMGYLSRHRDLKANPQKLLPGVKSVICVGLVYGAEQINQPDQAQVSIYTRGVDYHELMTEKLKILAASIQENTGQETRVFVDSEPVLDRFWAARAGLGWIGKNTCLINRKQGSFIFIGGIFTTAELISDSPVPDHCGKCRKCIDACPTSAITELAVNGNARFVINSNKCIAYHTIENRGEIPIDVAQKSDRWVAGCDICQTVCPWNDPVTVTNSFELSNLAFGASLSDLAKWTAHDFKERTTGIAMSRIKYAGFVRNLAIAIQNSALSESDRRQALNSLKEQAILLEESPSKRVALEAIERALI